MVKAKHRFYVKWRHTALSVGFLTIILVASAHAQSAEYIFWSNDKIRRANIDGSVPIDFISSSGATGFAIDPSTKMIYWIEDGTPGFIKRANMDGEGTETLRNDVARGRDFALDLNNNHMYWLETTCCIRRANLDGTGVTTIVNGFNAGRGIALDVPNNHIYWVEGNASKIQRNDLDGVNKNRTTLIDDSALHPGSNAGGQGIALDVTKGKMYWVEQSAGGKIRRANLDGTGAEVLITGMTGIGIALDLVGEHIFWGDWNVPRKIRRANLDGTDAQIWIAITGHHGIAIKYVSSSSGGPPVRYVPFRSQYVVLALFALLGCWYVLRRH
jgi:hypothetical protein